MLKHGRVDFFRSIKLMSQTFPEGKGVETTRAPHCIFAVLGSRRPSQKVKVLKQLSHEVPDNSFTRSQTFPEGKGVETPFKLSLLGFNLLLSQTFPEGKGVETLQLVLPDDTIRYVADLPRR